nr:hypothetical protein [Tanacetum cinerariifolium]
MENMDAYRDDGMGDVIIGNDSVTYQTARSHPRSGNCTMQLGTCVNFLSMVRSGPLKLRRNQVEDLDLTIKEGEVIDEPMEDIVKTWNDDNEIIMENMDAYRDDGMGDVIIGKPFCKEICVKAKRFDGMITIYNGNDSVTYQTARSHPRCKHLTNEQRNKMWPLLKKVHVTS